MVSTPNWKRGASAVCICTFMLGAGFEIERLTHPLCDWHRVACREQAEEPIHIHTDIGTWNLATSTG